MVAQSLPASIKALLAGHECERETIGMSGAAVYRCTGPGGTLYLKTEPPGGELEAEHRALQWLAGRLPVPEVLAWQVESSAAFMLTRALPGAMLCADETPAQPGALVGLLADALQMLQAVDIAHCPFDKRLDIKLATATENVRRGLVDTTDWEPDSLRRFADPQALLDWLRTHRPAEEVLAFTHGDCCLPNIFAQNGRVTGFLDLARCGVADPWQDIALAARSLDFNQGGYTVAGGAALLAQSLGVPMDEARLDYYILLDEMF